MSQQDTNPDRTIEDAYRELGVERILHKQYWKNIGYEPKVGE